MRTTFSSSSRPGCTSGSRSNTSSPAPAIVPDAERVGERRLVDDRAARRVDEERRRLHPRERRGIDQVARLRAERAVERDDVGGAPAARRAGGSAPRARVSTSAGACCRPAYAISIPNAAARRAVARPILPSPTIPSVLPWMPVPSMKNMLHDHGVRDRMSRSPSPRRRVAIRMSANAMSAVASVRHAGRVRHHDAAPGARRDVDVVVADRDVRDDAKPRARGVEERVVDPVVEQRHDAVRSGDGRVQLVRRKRPVVRRDPDVARRLEKLDRRLGDPPRDDDPRRHGLDRDSLEQAAPSAPAPRADAPASWRTRAGCAPRRAHRSRFRRARRRRPRRAAGRRACARRSPSPVTFGKA